jgi:ERCC4-type nuclease
MNVVVDMRETALLLALRPLFADLSGVSLTTAALPVGDVAIKVGPLEGDLAVLFERKSVDDLASSHGDGRYKEQRARLLAQRGAGVSIGYLVEGTASSFTAARFGEADLRNAILRLQFRYTIPVFPTSSVPDSAALIRAVVVALQRDPACFKGGLATTAAGAAAAYTEAIHVRKADNSTPDRVFRSMLRVVPGLGPTAVEGVAVAVGSSFARLLALSEAELAAIPVGKRRLGPALARVIHSVVHLPSRI